MRPIAARSAIILLVSALACSDSPRSPTGARESRPAAPQADIIRSAHPLDVPIRGDAKGCFGVGCTPAENVFYFVGTIALSYASAPADDFGGVSRHGIFAANGAAGNFGSVAASAGVGEDVSVPFTLELSFVTPSAAPLTFHGTLTGTGGVTAANTADGGFLLDFDPGSGPAVAGHTIDGIPFADPLTPSQGLMSVTAFGIAVGGGGVLQPIPGLFQTRER